LFIAHIVKRGLEFTGIVDPKTMANANTLLNQTRWYELAAQE
jgi:hypothetical protein